MCAVKVLTDDEAEHAVALEHILSSNGDPGNGDDSRGHAHSTSGSGGRLVPHLTNPNCMVQVMPTDAVLEAG